MENNHDLVSIGEIAIDAFIRLRDASVHCDVNKENCEICMAFGAKIPYESVTEVPAVANASNASVCASRLGLSSALVANMGNDRNGQLCLDALKKNGVDTDFIGIHEDKDTNYHYVLWFEDDRTILQKHSDFPYRLPNISNPKWIYLTSLGEKSLLFHKDIMKFLEANPNINLAFQPGIFQIKMGHENLKGIYERSDIFFCNVGEAKTILNISVHDDIRDLLQKIRNLGPKIVVITDGIRGAHAYDGERVWFQPPFPDIMSPLERTGAGDAFSSTVSAALALGNDLPTALSWGAVNSMSVVQQVGAQAGLLTRGQIEEYLNSAPSSFTKAQVI